MCGPRVIADRGSRWIIDSAAIRALSPGGLDLPRFSGEGLAQLAAIFSN